MQDKPTNHTLSRTQARWILSALIAAAVLFTLGLIASQYMIAIHVDTLAKTSGEVLFVREKVIKRKKITVITLTNWRDFNLYDDGTYTNDITRGDEAVIYHTTWPGSILTTGEFEILQVATDKKVVYSYDSARTKFRSQRNTGILIVLGLWLFVWLFIKGNRDVLRANK